MNPALIVRPACRHDLPAIAARSGATEDATARRLKVRHITCLVADGIESNLGHIFFEWNADHLFIASMSADQPTDELADTLLMAVWLKRGQRKWIDIIVPEDQLGLQLALKRNGFRAVHVLPRWFDNGLDGYQMERREDDE